MIDILNRWIGNLPKCKDPMNDYYPSTLWLDIETGTYGDATHGQLVLIDTTEWSSEDNDAWECMTDSEREGYGVEYRDYCGHHAASKFMKPALWVEVKNFDIAD